MHREKHIIRMHPASAFTPLSIENQFIPYPDKSEPKKICHKGTKTQRI